MFQAGRFAYGEDNSLNVRALRLPYESNDASFYVFLPKSSGVEALETLEKSLTTESMDRLFKGMKVQEVQVSIPKFKFEKSLKLKKTLEAMGMDLPFGTSADFSGITGDKQLRISDVIHKAVIEVMSAPKRLRVRRRKPADIARAM